MAIRMCKLVIFALKGNVRNIISVMISFSEKNLVIDKEAFLEKQGVYGLRNIDL